MMPDTTINPDDHVGEATQPGAPDLMSSTVYFERERREESRRRLATLSLWAGLLALLLLLVPNPVPWLAGPLAILLGIVALIRIRLDPQRHAGTGRALAGIIIGLVAILACRWWIQ